MLPGPLRPDRPPCPGLPSAPILVPRPRVDRRNVPGADSQVEPWAAVAAGWRRTAFPPLKESLSPPQTRKRQPPFRSSAPGHVDPRQAMGPSLWTA